MKKLFFFYLLIFIVTGLHATKYKPVTSHVTSVEINSVTGVFQFSVNYLFHDSVSLSNDIEIIAPNGWNVSLSPNIAGGTYIDGDNINTVVTVQYPIDINPFFSQTIQINHYSDPGSCSFIVQTYTKVFFTPYNTIEVWNMEDFSNLPRRWYTEQNAPFRQRLPIEKNTIPISNINTEVPVSWHDASRNWEDDNPDDFREVYIPGLAYSVLMKPMPEDSVGCSRPRVQ